MAAQCACSSMSLSQLVEPGMSYSKEVRLLTNGRLFHSKVNRLKTKPTPKSYFPRTRKPYHREYSYMYITRDSHNTALSDGK